MKKASPKIVLSEMITNVKENIDGIFTITRENKFEYESAHYGLCIVKPSKTIMNALGIQKEVVLLITNFQNLQVRTVLAAKQAIENGSGRYETNVAVIVHQDRSGDINLKKWGREHGISILPIHYNAGIPKGQELLQTLCYELYSHDPFDITGPVSNDTQFYGRRSEAQDLARKLQLGQIRSLLGIRKIGKTSIINRVVNELQSFNCLTIMIDCSSDEVWSMHSEDLMSAIVESIKSSLENSEKYKRLTHHTANGKKVFEKATELQKIVQISDKPIVLIFDEIDYLTPSSPTNEYWQNGFNEFWRNLRVIYQELARSNSVLSIVVGGVSSKWFTVGEINGIENSVLSFIPEEYLTPMPRGATIAMMNNIGKTAGLHFDDKSSDFIAMETADMPYWTRKACSYIHRHISIDERPLVIEYQRIKILMENFIKNEGAIISEVAIRHLFGIYPELERELNKIYHNSAEEINIRNKSTLLRYGIIKEKQDLKFAGSMIKAGYDMYKQYSLENIEEVLVKNDSFSLSIDEWADEIAIISRRRNVLEKKMREMALNFLKMDKMQNNTVKAPKERLLAILQESQRNTYAHMSADEIINKFMWTDLYKFFTNKDWQLFEKLIGDKNHFLLNANIINDRPEAHAKKADAADFAMYRRSLKHIEDIFSKLD